MYRRLAIAGVLVVLVLIVGTIGYMVIDDWSLVDSLYMTVITVGTVGYGEVRELTEAGRVFTMGLIFAGFGVMLFFLGTVIDFIVEGHLRGLVEGRRMQSRIESLNGHHVVAGLGRVGSVVARILSDEGVSFVVIDQDAEAITAAKEEGWLVVEGDATDETTLEAAGLERARSLITALDSDADNLYVTFSARAMCPELFIVSRSNSETSENKLKRAGANRVMTLNVIGARRMATMVLHPVVSDFLDLVSHGDDIELRLQEVELEPNCALVGKSIKDSKVRDTTGVYILAVQGSSGGVNSNPASDTVLNTGDKLVVLGTTAQLNSLMQSL